MLATLVTFGSRGDAEPFVALAERLVGRGHEVRLVTHAMFVPMVEGRGIDFTPVRGRSVQALLDDPAVRAVVEDPHRPVRALRRMSALIATELHLLYEDTRDAVEGADVVVCAPLTFPALHAADRAGVPVVHAQLQPFVPTGAFPVPAGWVRARSLGAAVNRASYDVDAALTNLVFRRAVNQCRAEVLGLGPQTLRAGVLERRPRHGALVAVSSHVVPRPLDWPHQVRLCGWWWPAPTPEAGAGVDGITGAFLESGPPPVLVSLGSMPVADPEAMTQLLAGAAGDAGVRLVLQRGWAGLGEGLEDTGHVHVVDDMPHDRLLPHVAAVVHHGGAGTTGRGLLHGRPTLALPVLGDQFFWGRRLRALGVGPPPLPLAKIGRQALAARLGELVSDRSSRARAGHLGERLRQEDGVGVAAFLLEQFAAPARRAWPHRRPP